MKKEIEMKIRNLPVAIKREVLDYVEFLLRKYPVGGTPKGKFKFNWSGGLSDIKGKVTSVELQHKAMEWR
ncbi:MAG: DUF2281 domain-containing protein [Planctomycetota bacterium]